MTMLAAVEAGGTKFRAAVMGADLSVLEEERIPTTDPDETLGATSRFLARFADRIDALGIGSFGPLDLRPGSPSYGSVAATPKPGWSGVSILERLQAPLGVPAVIDTDVGAAALAEWSMGAGKGADVIVYVTVGTGIGAAVLVDGAVHHGHGHSEIGHLPVKRQVGDEFAGACPFHGDCLEGMASGSAVAVRRDTAGEGSSEFVPAYLAQLVRALTYVVAPDRIIFGGGLFNTPELLAAAQGAVEGELAGYSTNPELVAAIDEYVVGAALGQDAGLLGAGVLAQRAVVTA